MANTREDNAIKARMLKLESKLKSVQSDIEELRYDFAHGEFNGAQFEQLAKRSIENMYDPISRFIKLTGGWRSR